MKGRPGCPRMRCQQRPAAMATVLSQSAVPLVLLAAAALLPLLAGADETSTCQAMLKEFHKLNEKEAVPYGGDNMVYFLHVPRCESTTATQQEGSPAADARAPAPVAATAPARSDAPPPSAAAASPSPLPRAGPRPRACTRARSPPQDRGPHVPLVPAEAGHAPQPALPKVLRPPADRRARAGLPAAVVPRRLLGGAAAAAGHGRRDAAAGAA
jgi:hypothetical protein